MDVTIRVGQSAGDEDAPGHELDRVIAPPRRAAEQRSHGALRALLAAASFFGACAKSPPAKAQDAWWGPDKALHCGVSAGLAAGGYAVSSIALDKAWQRATAGAAFSLSAGAAKELWDLSGHGDPSLKDLAWDGIGTALGVALALALDTWVFEREQSPSAQRAALALRW